VGHALVLDPRVGQVSDIKGGGELLSKLWVKATPSRFTQSNVCFPPSVPLLIQGLDVKTRRHTETSTREREKGMAGQEEEEVSTAATGRRGDSESEGEERVAAVLDFDMLCASVVLAAERRKGAAAAEADSDGGVGGGVQRMWEGDVVLDCLDDRRIALEAAW
jgi:hypothetical protein